MDLRLCAGRATDLRRTEGPDYSAHIPRNVTPGGLGNSIASGEILATMMALPIPSAGRFSPLGPLGIGVLPD